VDRIVELLLLSSLSLSKSLARGSRSFPFFARSAQFFLRKIESTLNGYLSAVARRNAAAEAEKTEASNGPFNPKAMAMAKANSNSKNPLRKA